MPCSAALQMDDCTCRVLTSGQHSGSPPPGAAHLRKFFQPLQREMGAAPYNSGSSPRPTGLLCCLSVESLGVSGPLDPECIGDRHGTTAVSCTTGLSTGQRRGEPGPRNWINRALAVATMLGAPLPLRAGVDLLRATADPDRRRPPRCRRTAPLRKPCTRRDRGPTYVCTEQKGLLAGDDTGAPANARPASLGARPGGRLLTTHPGAFREGENPGPGNRLCARLRRRRRAGLHDGDLGRIDDEGILYVEDPELET